MKKIESVRQVVDGFTENDVVFWNTMKMGYAQNGMVFEAFDGFREMVQVGKVKLNESATLALILAYIVSENLTFGREIHEFLGYM